MRSTGVAYSRMNAKQKRSDGGVRQAARCCYIGYLMTYLNRLATAVKSRDMRYSIPGLKNRGKRKRHCRSRRGEYLGTASCSAEWVARG